MRSREDNAIFTSVPIEDIEFYKQTNEELQQENKQLKEEIEKYKTTIEIYQPYFKGINLVKKIEKMQELEELEGKGE